MALDIKITSKMRLPSIENSTRNVKCDFRILMGRLELHKDTITAIDINEKECHLLLMENLFNTHKSIGTNITIILVFGSI